MKDDLAKLENETTGFDADPLTSEEVENLRNRVIEALKTVYDPEIPVDIHELGLIYGLEVSANASVSIKMTLTSPACPVAGSLPGDVESKVRAVYGVKAVDVELVWDPPWDMEKMSEGAKLELGFL